MENKDQKPYLVIIALIAVMATAFAGYFYWQGGEMKNQIKTLQEEKTRLENALSEKEKQIAEIEKQKTKTVKSYYYNPDLDRGDNSNILCSRQGLVAVERKIPVTITPIKDTINLLLKGGLTEEERARGITTEYPLEGLTLKNAVLNNGILTLTFDDLNNKTVGGSCRVGILWFQIEATAKQFPEVKKVQFLPEELFQP